MIKKNLFLLMILLSGTFALTVMTSCEKDDEEITNETTTCELTQEQQQGLLYMREEEKLARDVYTYLYDKWNVNIFKNIAKAEQKHMDLLLNEVDSCKLDDLVLPEAGKFVNSHIQELYDALTAKGDESLVDALQVGATIEDVDIYDLNDFSNQTDNQTLLDIYEKLTCGSRNHMRAFVGWLENKGETYTPQYITPELYNSIISGEHESCGQ